MVVTPHTGIARWARRPLPLGPGSIIQPVALGPQELPRITDPVFASQNPELALLSLLSIRKEGLELRLRIHLAAEQAFRQLPDDRGKRYFDVGRAVIPDDVRTAMEDVMAATGQSRYHSEFARRFVEEGREERLILRFGPLPEPIRHRVAHANAETLERWSGRLASMTGLDDLGDPS